MSKKELKKPVKKIKGYNEKDNRFNFSASPMKQNDFEFYTLSIPSEVLEKTCFVTNRFQDSEEGFQRTLNERKARQIAKYIDEEGGTIPTSIVLSAQPEADVQILSRKTLSFKNTKNAFLIIDGQHRVWGYIFAKYSIRVPVVIYKGLDKSQEARLFEDVNSKQTPVPAALLLDIKRLAQTEDSTESYLGDLFNLFHDSNTSCLQGRMTKAGETNKKLNRVNFNRALKQLLKSNLDFKGKGLNEIYKILNQYLRAFIDLKKMNVGEHIHKSNVFYSLVYVFPEVVIKVHSDFGKDYTYDNFSVVLNRCFGNVTESKLKSNISSLDKLKSLFLKQLDEKIEL